MTGPKARTPPGDDRAERLGNALVRARTGESGAMEEIVRALNPLLWHVARSHGARPHEVADVVQIAWVELIRRLDAIDNPGALTAWLVTTTKREAWRTARRSRRTDLLDEPPDVPDDSPAAVDLVIVDERDEVLWRHFERLSERCRQLLRLVALRERPDYREVSASLDMPHGSIGPTRARCLSRLRELLVADPRWAAS